METRHLFMAFALATTPMSAVAQNDAGVAAVKPLYENAKGWLIQSVEQMPEEHFSFKPTPEVRSFGELMGHVANANYLVCAGATGEENPNDTDYEKVTSKEELVAGVTAAFDYCDSAYQMSETKALEEITFFGQTGTRLWVLMFNVSHDMQHYGNVVTYMRLKGMVPPSSQGGM
jgi:uncharacterized damage-inducible protein DinB